MPPLAGKDGGASNEVPAATSEPPDDAEAPTVVPEGEQTNAETSPSAQPEPPQPETRDVATAVPPAMPPTEIPITADEPAPETRRAPSVEDLVVEMPSVGEIVAAESGAQVALASGAPEITPVVEAGDVEAEGIAVHGPGEAETGTPDVRLLAINAAEMESNTLYVAGEAEPGTMVQVFAAGELIGEARAGEEGAWLLEAAAELPLGEIVIRAEAEAGDATTPIEVAETPFVRFPDSIVLEPLSGAAVEDAALTEAAGELPTPAYIIIRRGDNLWRIARRNYGRGIKYHAIFEANRDKIRNPHLIFPGQVFIIPTSDRTWETAVH
jgi:nucleoid-associated protein YgaU